MVVSGEWSWLKEGLSNIDHVAFDIFALGRSKDKKSFDLYQLTKPNNEDIASIRQKTSNELKILSDKLQNKNTSILDFFNDGEDLDESSTVYTLNVSKYASIREAINVIHQPAESIGFNPKKIENARLWCMVYNSSSDDEIVIFGKIKALKKYKKAMFVAEYKEDGLHILKDPIIAFDTNIACIYFNKTKKLIVLNKSATESVFQLIEHYKHEGDITFKKLIDLKIITIADDFLQKQLTKIRYARKISNMMNRNMFPTNIDLYLKYQEFFKTHTDFNITLTPLEIIGNKVVLDTHDKFRSFLRMTDLDIVSSVVKSDKLYVALQKQTAQNSVKLQLGSQEYNSS